MRVDTLLCLGGVGAGGRSQPLPGPVQHLPVTAVASAASGLRDYLKSWRAEPWLLRCEDTIAFAVSLFSGDRAALLEGCPVGARVERVLGSRGGGQAESPISHVHLGGPVAWGPPDLLPPPLPLSVQGCLGAHPAPPHTGPRGPVEASAGDCPRQQGCWAWGPALGGREPRTHGHIRGWHPGPFPGRGPSSPSTAGLQALL